MSSLPSGPPACFRPSGRRYVVDLQGMLWKEDASYLWEVFPRLSGAAVADWLALAPYVAYLRPQSVGAIEQQCGVVVTPTVSVVAATTLTVGTGDEVLMVSPPLAEMFFTRYCLWRGRLTLC